MKKLIGTLMTLQRLDWSKGDAAAIAELRAQIPAPIMGHYDRLKARGKKGVASVRNSVCGECHVGIPLGVLATVARGLDIQLCGNCGRYLYFPEDAPNPFATPPAKPAKKPKRSKKPTPPETTAADEVAPTNRK